MSCLCLQNAMLVAHEKYHEDGLKIDFMAVSALNDALVQSVGMYEDYIDGISQTDLKDALSAILTRNQHSEEFYTIIEQGRKLSLYSVQQDRRVLTDLKNWDVLDNYARVNSANYFANLLHDIFSSHVGLAPVTKIIAQQKDEHVPPIIDYSTFNVYWNPNAGTVTEFPRSEQITIDTRHESFESASVTYSQVYMSYLRILEKNLNKRHTIEKFSQAIDKIPHDVELCDAAISMKGFVDPLLSDVGLYHFSNMLVATEGQSMLRGLDDILETHAHTIQSYQRVSFQDKINLFLAKKGFHL